MDPWASSAARLWARLWESQFAVNGTIRLCRPGGLLRALIPAEPKFPVGVGLPHRTEVGATP